MIDPNPTPVPQRRTRPMTRDEVIAIYGIEARCFYKVWVDGHIGPAAPWPRVPVGPAGVLEVARLVDAQTKRIRQ